MSKQQELKVKLDEIVAKHSSATRQGGYKAAEGIRVDSFWDVLQIAQEALDLLENKNGS